MLGFWRLWQVGQWRNFGIVHTQLMYALEKKSSGEASCPFLDDVSCNKYGGCS